MRGYFVGTVLMIIGLINIKRGMKKIKEPDGKAELVFGCISFLAGGFDFLSTLLFD